MSPSSGNNTNYLYSLYCHIVRGSGSSQGAEVRAHDFGVASGNAAVLTVISAVTLPNANQ